ncbi:hypothetical protein [Nonomuraea sp. NPDC050643]|uniref:hypothetical protein n=1 Tax=Nonomuraea sp. NPDC050643 TaxID=3155660 RepID=UPI0033E862C3
MTEHIDTRLKALDRLVGTWKVTGGAEGTVTYRWMEGGHFLIQDVDLEQDGTRVKGTEFIGRKRPYGADRPSEDVHSWYFDSQGATLAYVYEIDGDTLTIWAHERNSEAYYRGTFDADGTSVTGGWVYPGGGGYASDMTRVS